VRRGRACARALMQGSVTSSSCTATHPRFTRFTDILGVSISETTMRPNPSLSPAAGTVDSQMEENLCVRAFAESALRRTGPGGRRGRGRRPRARRRRRRPGAPATQDSEPGGGAPGKPHSELLVWTPAGFGVRSSGPARGEGGGTLSSRSGAPAAPHVERPRPEPEIHKDGPELLS
jgi:hypothetical protein